MSGFAALLGETARSESRSRLTPWDLWFLLGFMILIYRPDMGLFFDLIHRVRSRSPVGTGTESEVEDGLGPKALRWAPLGVSQMGMSLETFQAPLPKPLVP